MNRKFFSILFALACICTNSHADVGRESQKPFQRNEVDASAFFEDDGHSPKLVQLDEAEMSDTEGGATSPTYRCTLCGAPHGGVYSPKVCFTCLTRGAGGSYYNPYTTPWGW